MSPYIIYSKLSLKTEYRPPYNRKVCNYKLAETDFIKRAIADCDWPSLFLGKHVHQQAEILRETFLNIFHNYIRNKFISCGDKDPPWIMRNSNLWFTGKIICIRDKENLVALTIYLEIFLSNAVSSSKSKYDERLVNKINDRELDLMIHVYINSFQ